MTVRLQTALLLIIVATVGELARGQAPSAARTVLVAGQVIDGTTGSPISGAVVTLGGDSPGRGAEAPAPAVPRVLTTATGRFVLRDVPPGSYRLVASKPGSLLAEYGRSRPAGLPRPLALTTDDRAIEVVIRMWRAAAISGTVVDEGGEPIANAIVRTYRRMGFSGQPVFLEAGRATTDDRGVYRIGDLVPGEYGVMTMQVPSVTVASRDPRTRAVPALPIPPPARDGRVWVYPTTFYPGMSTIGQASVVTVGSGEERPAVDFNLHPVPTFRVSGVVTSGDGPVSGTQAVWLTAAGDDDPGLAQEKLSTSTDGTGSFTFATVPSGQYNVAVVRLSQPLAPQLRSPGSREWAKIPVTVEQSDVDGLAVTLQPGLTISGVLQFDGAGPRPAPHDIGITVESVGGSKERSSMFVDTAATGDFTLRGYPPGRYLLDATVRVKGWVFKSALYNGRDISTSPFDLLSNVSGVVLTFMDHAVGVTGTVRTTRGEPDASALVAVFPADAQDWTPFGSNPRRWRSTRSARDGSYRFDALPPGEYYVAALTDDEAAEWSEPGFLQSIARSAARVSISEQTVTQDLRSRGTP